MKKFTTLLLMAIFILNYTAKPDAIKNTQVLIEEEKSLSSFRGIASGGPLHVKITMGNTTSIRFEGNKHAIDDLKVEILEGILNIKPKTKWNEWSRKHKRPSVTVYIQAKNLSSLTLSGSGNMEITNTLNGSDLVTTLSGSGKIKGNTNVLNYAAVLSGSGHINITGKANLVNLTISGSGSFNGKGLTVKKAAVQISGSANAYLNATETLDAVISGSGRINYSGEAKVTKTIIGSGRVTKN